VGECNGFIVTHVQFGLDFDNALTNALMLVGLFFYLIHFQIKFQLLHSRYQFWVMIPKDIPTKVSQRSCVRFG
jgi:hypothetical protein